MAYTISAYGRSTGPSYSRPSISIVSKPSIQSVSSTPSKLLSLPAAIYTQSKPGTPQPQYKSNYTAQATYSGATVAKPPNTSPQISASNQQEAKSLDKIENTQGTGKTILTYIDRVNKEGINPDYYKSRGQTDAIKQEFVNLANFFLEPTGSNLRVPNIKNPDLFIDVNKRAYENGQLEGKILYNGTMAYASAAGGGLISIATKVAGTTRIASEVDNVIAGTSNTVESILPSWVTRKGLAEVASTPGKGGVTPIGRAFQKHAGNAQRAGTFTGEVTGNITKNTEQGMNYLNQVLDNPNSTAVVRNTKAYGDVLDIRIPDGTGVRYSADVKTFIGFLEKYTPTK